MFHEEFFKFQKNSSWKSKYFCPQYISRVNPFKINYDDMKRYYAEEGKEFEEIEFVYEYDMASFLSYYCKAFSLAGLSRITGVNQGQLSHYVTGHRTPSERTKLKIQNSIQEFAKELSLVHFL